MKKIHQLSFCPSIKHCSEGILLWKLIRQKKDSLIFWKSVILKTIKNIKSHPITVFLHSCLPWNGFLEGPFWHHRIDTLKTEQNKFEFANDFIRVINKIPIFVFSYGFTLNIISNGTFCLIHNTTKKAMQLSDV